MVPAPPALPTRFPCWCRAVYSWGGESPRDLGFVEGDLIECLNAGDGSWWMGRLRRNKTVGVFPSNFVEVLPDHFRPVSRSTSPLPASSTPSPVGTPLQKKKSKPFRKPFEAYAKAPHYTTAKQPEVIRDMPTRQNSNHQSQRAQRAPTETRTYMHRGPSPAPSSRRPESWDARTARQPSPIPPLTQRFGSWDARITNPAPPVNRNGSWETRAQRAARAPSPVPPPQDQGSWGSRTARAYSPVPPPQDQGSWGSRTARAHSPVPPLSHQGSWDRRLASPAPLTSRNGSWDTRAPSPTPPLNHQGSWDARLASPAPLAHRTGPWDTREPSPAPMHIRQDSWDLRQPSPLQMSYFGTKAPSPVPSPVHQSSRAPSPTPSSFIPYRPGAELSQAESPPPPPPPHRNAVLTRGGGSNASRNPRPVTPRGPSPVPPSPGGDGFTPSPLREAMDGVIEQLDALGMQPQHSRDSPEPPLDPWSPESFDMVRHRSRRKPHHKVRPQTSMGVVLQDEGYETYSGNSSQENTNHGGYGDEPEPPQLSNYVERMESRIRKMHQHSSSMNAMDATGMAPPPPSKKQLHIERPKSALSVTGESDTGIRRQKSVYGGGRLFLNRTSTTKTNSTNASSGNRSTTTTSSATTQSTNRSLMSGTSAGGMSATSAGDLARKNRARARSELGFRRGERNDDYELDRSTTPFSGVSYHASHSSSQAAPYAQTGQQDDGNGIAAVGGLVQPEAKPKKSNFIKRILEATKTGVASGRSTIGHNAASTASPAARSAPNVVSAVAGGAGTSSVSLGRDAAREMALVSGGDWVQVRRDVNRSNTLSRNERNERRDRCQMLDYPAINPVDEFFETLEGDEDGDGMPVREPVNFQIINLSQVDKNSRFIGSLPPMTTAVTLATSYVCRPYRSEVQRLRAIFIWVAEKIAWEEDLEVQVDTRRVIQAKRGCAEEYAVLVHEMCTAVGIHSEVVRGYLKTPGEVPETTIMPRSNHWWNAVLIDNEWRMIDCCLASMSNPKRALYSSASNTAVDSWWFLTRPSEICWTHIPEHHLQQHMCPPVSHEVLLNLPGACPAFFKNELAMVDYNTSLVRIENLEMVHIKFNVPADVEVAAEVEVRTFTRDADGDVFESGEVVKKRALAQAEWYNGTKRYTVKGLLPGDEGIGVLKVYAGKRGLMHSIKDIPHPLAFALPVIHTGDNPAYEFVTRHPTPHAQRHDIYVVQPQCQRLALNNTFVFAIRQHPSLSPSSTMTPSSNPGGTSPIPFARPPSSMSMNSSNPSTSTASSSGYGGGTVAGKKPAKLAIQTPGGKILRLMRKEDRRGVGTSSRNIGGEDEVSDGGTWETIIKCSERGVWRGLVLADRTARWCVFAEWTVVG